MIEIKRASDCVNDIRSQMTELFIEGFWHLLQLLSKDRNKLKTVFYHTFLLDKFFVAVENGKMIGMVGYAESTKSSLHLDKHEFILETTDTNIPAITAYKKIGFKEYDRLKQKYAKQSGINYFIYLKYTKSTDDTGVT